MSVLVFVNDSEKMHGLLHVACKKAEEQQSDWTAVHVDAENSTALNENVREKITANLKIASEMGANVDKVIASTPESGIKKYIKDAVRKGNKITNIVIGRSVKTGFFSELTTPLSAKIAKSFRGSAIEIHSVPIINREYSPSWFERFKVRRIYLKDICVALCAVGAALIASQLLQYVSTEYWFDSISHNIVSLFLIATVVSALLCGLWAGSLAALLSVLLTHVFFTQPFGKFGFTQTSDIVDLLVFMASAVIVSLMGSYSRSNHRLLLKKEKNLRSFYNIYRVASVVTTRKEALQRLRVELSELLDAEIVFFLPTAYNPNTPTLTYPNHIELSDSQSKEMLRCWRELKHSYAESTLSAGSGWHFRPIITKYTKIGVIGVKFHSKNNISSATNRLLLTLCDQVGSIIESVENTEEAQKNKLYEEREKLRNLLLSSVSHDLKTPLASVIGSISVHQRLSSSGRLTESISNELLSTALEEAQRLNNFISNIIDMTRIESNDVAITSEWLEVTALVSEIIQRMKQQLNDYSFVVNYPKNKTEIFVDSIMMSQVLTNLLDNAMKYSNKGSDITLDCYVDNQEEKFFFSITDRGCGIPTEQYEKIFDKYERLKHSDTKVAGTGLGLAISKAIMQLMDGEIMLESQINEGSTFYAALSKYRTSLNSEKNAA